MGKAGGCSASQLEAVGRLVSLAFRSGIEYKVIVEQLRNIRCPSPSWNKGGKVYSCSDAIAKTIEKVYITDTNKQDPNENEKPAMKHSHDDDIHENPGHRNVVGVCPDCGHSLSHEEGCIKCGSCGYTKC